MNKSIKPNTIRSSTLQQKIGTTLRRVAVSNEHLIVESNGFPIVAIIPLGDYHALLKDRERLESIVSARSVTEVAEQAR